ncbi:MAG TPA: hypothetical protein VLE72_02440 [Candidatus Saccharimonadales bacterium]|nr:hypothetical protein [Candidatus Saccharimonadales bacterium]
MKRAQVHVVGKPKDLWVYSHYGADTVAEDVGKALKKVLDFAGVQGWRDASLVLPHIIHQMMSTEDRSVRVVVKPPAGFDFDLVVDCLALEVRPTTAMGRMIVSFESFIEMVAPASATA